MLPLIKFRKVGNKKHMNNALITAVHEAEEIRERFLEETDPVQRDDLAGQLLEKEFNACIVYEIEVLGRKGPAGCRTTYPTVIEYYQRNVRI